MRVGVFGDPAFGGVQLRGVQVAEQMGWEFVPLDQLHQAGRFDFGIVVKYFGHHGQALRNICGRLIYDPLDAWHQGNPNVYAHWWERFEALQPDVVIATSPACEAVMRLSTMPATHLCTVAMIPHQPDARLMWVRDPQGPIVYDGELAYLGGEWKTIVAAAKRLGLRAKHGTAADRGQRMGVSLLLHPRLGRTATTINRYCKPQIKLANAAHCGLPVLATDDPAVMTLARTVTVLPVSAWSDIDILEQAMRTAIDAEPVHPDLAFAHYGERLRKVMESL